ncbi:hypothetical protein IMG5_184190 [Ichthyophthirius multifiliis]|uniref:Actin-related protein 8 n=1 Tax=Ichthyophthirius multifiliis TaxID=5932 RepID=G0R3B1_ICHMU|nr:hypothetical protein IMG5_184190 [Ichthyophthirius multifiliis]EGR28054.1 hypothetical protein IMG5_184190 [Ichthyophthirius multifiliis]|eukprot:XP_004027399.1 hypothetical protein IMG5_184190 [Ichthyophthirius multifiliis]
MNTNQAKIQDQSREFVQSTIKSLYQRSEHIEKMLEKGNDSLVFQIGSHSIKYGFANEQQPQKIRTLIAYRTNNSETTFFHDNYRNYDILDKECQKIEQQLKQQKKLNQNAQKSQKKTQKTKVELNLKTLIFQNKMEIENDPKADFSKKNILFEDEIFMIEQNPEFMIRKPIKHGCFNTSEYQENYNAIINDIENLIYYILTKKMNLKQRQFNQYNIILIIPDLMNRFQLKMLVTMFLQNLNFNSLYMHQESIMACFGFCIGQACVVDIGSEKINVCCVDEGIIIPNTLIRKNYGGDDVDVVLLRQLIKKNCTSFKKKGNYKLEYRNFGDMHQIEKLKEKYCSFEFIEDSQNRIYEMHCVRNGIEELFTVQHNESMQIAPQSYFNAEIFNSLQKNTQNNYKNLNFDHYDYTSKYFDYNEDPEDNLEDVIEILQQQQYIQQLQQNTYKLKQEELLDPYLMVNLEDIISQSIANVKDSELRKKLANHIFIIGGGNSMQNMAEQLEDKLIERIAYFDPNIERVEVIDALLKKEINLCNLSWIGGTVIPRLDSMKDQWIKQNRWLGCFDNFDDDSDEEGDVSGTDLQNVNNQQKKEEKDKKDKSNEYGIKYLKEKIPFQW